MAWFEGKALSVSRICRARAAGDDQFARAELFHISQHRAQRVGLSHACLLGRRGPGVIGLDCDQTSAQQSFKLDPDFLARSNHYSFYCHD
jgi:hypothetical protein